MLCLLDAYTIPALRALRKYCMRGYGGFPPPAGDGSWTTKSYRVMRIQLYSLLEPDGNLIPHSYWPIGSEGGGTWEVVEEALSVSKSQGGILNLSIWIDNIDQDMNGIPKASYDAWLAFFQKLKIFSGQRQMIIEPCWEWNGHGPVSPAHMRDCHIEPEAYLEAMTKVRQARDTVGIKCSIVSHMLALHGDKWYDPERETWKRTYMIPWFNGMKKTDLVTVSLYLSSADFGDFAAENWIDYLKAIYRDVVYLQKQETGWNPAVYVGTSEHNLNNGNVSDKEVWRTDFKLAYIVGLRLFGFWMAEFPSKEILDYVNYLASKYQSISIPAGNSIPVTPIASGITGLMLLAAGLS